MKAFIVVCLAAAAVADPNLVLPYSTAVPSALPYWNPLIAQHMVQARPMAEPLMKVEKDGLKADTYVKKEVPGLATTYQNSVIRAPVPYALPIAATPYAGVFPAANGFVTPFVTQKVKTFADDSAKPENYASKNEYVAETEGSVHIAKREAEADPALVYSMYNGAIAPQVYGAYPGIATPVAAANPLVYGQPLAYNNPLVYGQPLAFNKPVVPSVFPTVYNTLKVKSFSDDSVKPENYASKNEYMAKTEGSVHIAKREAEADPALVYSTYNGAFNTAAATTPIVRSTAFTTPYMRTAPYTTPLVAGRTISPYYNTLGYYGF